MADIFVGSVNVGVTPDARGWEQKLRDQIVEPSKKVGDEAGKEVGKGVESGMAGAGDDSAKKFGEAYKAKLKEVLDSLPEAKIDGNTTGVDRKVEDLRLKLTELSHEDIINPKTAIRNLLLVETDLKVLGDMSKSIRLDFDTKGAMVKLAELRVEESRLLAGALPGGGGAAGKKRITLGGLETLVGTGAGATGAGSSVLGNIMAFFGGIGGFFGGGGGGGGGGAGKAAGAGGGGGIADLLGGGLMSPAVIIPVIAAAAPFIGQIVGGAIVGVLGSGLVAMGVVGAGMTGKLTAPLKALTTEFTKDMKTIGTPFILPLREVLKQAGIVMTKMTPVFTKVSQILGVPFQKFLDAIVKSFGSPAVAKSIEAVANAFVAILTAVTPDIAPDMTMIANSITSLANAIAKNPQAMANVFQYIVNIVNFLIAAVTDLANIATFIERWHIPGLSVPVTPPPGTPPGRPPTMKPVTAGDVVGATARHLGHEVALSGDVVAALAPSTRSIRQRASSAAAGARQFNQAVTFSNNTTPGWMQFFSNQSMNHITDNVREFFVRIGVNIKNWAINAWNWFPGAIVRAWEHGHNLMVGWGHDIAHWFDNVKNWFIQGWNWIYSHTIGAIIRMVAHARQLFDGWWQNIKNWFNNAKTGIETAWNWIYNNTVGAVVRMVTHVMSLFAGWWNNIQNWFNNTKQWISQAWNNIYNNTIGKISSMITKAMSLFSGWKTNIINWGKDALTWLTGTGKSIVQGLYNGISGVLKTVRNWLHDNVYVPILNSIKAVFGIKNPAMKMVPIGKSIITGIVHGMLGEGKHISTFVAKIFGDWPHAIAAYVSKGAIAVTKNLPKAAISALMGIWGNPIGAIGAAGAAGILKLMHAISGGGAGGVSRWAGTVSKALTMMRLPQSLVGSVLYQMQTESGGDPNAVNLWDINAKRGDPSRGLMQVIGSTFARFHVPGTSFNILDPLANIASAINYAMHTYGPNLRNARGGIGSGHGYDIGGWLPTGVTLAYNLTGQKERILSPSEYNSLQAGGTQYHAHFDGLTGVAIESHVRTAFSMMNFTQGAMYRQGRRS